LKILLAPPLEHKEIPILKFSIKLKIINFKIRVVVQGGAVLLLWAHIFLPLWHESPKTESLEPSEVLSPPLVKK
jgi:hypothetical protein